MPSQNCVKQLNLEQLAYLAKALESVAGKTTAFDIAQLTVERVCRAVKLNGEESIALKTMGRPVGSNGILTSEQEALTLKPAIFKNVTPYKSESNVGF
jgi:hypothetical protein